MPTPVQLPQVDVLTGHLLDPMVVPGGWEFLLLSPCSAELRLRGGAYNLEKARSFEVLKLGWEHTSSCYEACYVDGEFTVL